VKIETDGGEIVTTGISGRLEAQSGGGTIHLDDIGGAINAETGGGAIDVGNVGADLTVRTGGGSIHIGSAKGKVVAESGGGSVMLVSGLQGASLETGGGVRVHWRKIRGWVEIKVEDDGPGLANTGNLFVPFFTTKPGGSGIGLVLCRQIAEGHGGVLTLENRRNGPGCEAKLRLPI
jgi:signal transduction histidine kinase